MHGVPPRKRGFSKCRSRSDLDNCPVPILVAYHLMTSYYFYYPSITLYLMSIKWLWGNSSNRRQYRRQCRRQCRRQSFHLLCVHNEVLGPCNETESSFFLSFGLPIDTKTSSIEEPMWSHSGAGHPEGRPPLRDGYLKHCCSAYISSFLLGLRRLACSSYGNLPSSTGKS